MPIGGTFVIPPTNHGKVISGSATVLINGAGRGPERRHGADLQRPGADAGRHRGGREHRADRGLTVTGILGSGWAFPVIPAADGGLALVSDETGSGRASG